MKNAVKTEAWWGDDFFEILNPHQKDELVRCYHEVICTCKNPFSLGVVHRADAPCYIPQKHEWVWLTDEEIEASKPPLSNDAVVWELAVEWAEAKLKKKNI